MGLTRQKWGIGTCERWRL